MYEMKESGIAWLGVIPSNWTAKKLGHMTEIITDGTHHTPNYIEDGIPFLSIKDISSGRIDFSDVKFISDAEHQELYKRAPIKRGDILFTRIGTLGVFVEVDTDTVFDIFVSVGMLRLKPNIVNTHYLLHYLNSPAVTNYIQGIKAGFGTAAPKYNLEDVKKTLVLLPPENVQKKIADFLDAKCAEINALRDDLKRQIDVLEQYKRSVIAETVTKGLNPDAEMKDSGIQWIGMMPSHWNCIRGKYILQYIQKPVCENDGVITCFRDGEVTLRSNRREDGFTMADKEIGYQGIDIGDLVVHGMDGFAGAIGISDSRGKASPVLNVLDTEQNKRYIMYFLRSMAYSDVFLAMATGIRVRSCDLRWNKLAELFYPVPPIEEQEAIVEYIDSVLTKTNDVIAAKKEQLSILEAYKKSLIFEYVTGKKEVPVPVTAVMVDPNVILLGKLPKLLSEQKGKIYNQKVLYLLNIYLGLNLDVQYYRYKHGPYDLKLDSYIDTLAENGWCVKIDNNGAENLGIGPNYGAFEEKFGSHFSEYDAEINKLIQFIQPMKRTQLERVATLFAVWNDMILDGNSAPTDAEIVSEVMSGWTENKANSAYETWLNTLNKMKLHHIVPKGQGLHTLPKDRCTNGYTQEGGAKA